MGEMLTGAGDIDKAIQSLQWARSSSLPELVTELEVSILNQLAPIENLTFNQIRSVLPLLALISDNNFIEEIIDLYRQKLSVEEHNNSQSYTAKVTPLIKFYLERSRIAEEFSPEMHKLCEEQIARARQGVIRRSEMIELVRVLLEVGRTTEVKKLAERTFKSPEKNSEISGENAFKIYKILERCQLTSLAYEWLVVALERSEPSASKGLTASKLLDISEELKSNGDIELSSYAFAIAKERISENSDLDRSEKGLMKMFENLMKKGDWVGGYQVLGALLPRIKSDQGMIRFMSLVSYGIHLLKSFRDEMVLNGEEVLKNAGISH